MHLKNEVQGKLTQDDKDFIDNYFEQKTFDNQDAFDKYIKDMNMFLNHYLHPNKYIIQPQLYLIRVFNDKITDKSFYDLSKIEERWHEHLNALKTQLSSQHQAKKQKEKEKKSVKKGKGRIYSKM